jgi:hypothetical protein
LRTFRIGLFYPLARVMSYRFFGKEYNRWLYIETLRCNLGEIGLQALDEGRGAGMGSGTTRNVPRSRSRPPSSGGA